MGFLNVIRLLDLHALMAGLFLVFVSATDWFIAFIFRTFETEMSMDNDAAMNMR
jgi:hypothetical protein